MSNADGDIELKSVLDELLRRERIFHHPEFGTTRADLEAMIAEDFCELGASGRVYSRATALEVLERRMAEPQVNAWQNSNFRCRRLASDVYLLTYDLGAGRGPADAAVDDLAAFGRRMERCLPSGNDHQRRMTQPGPAFYDRKMADSGLLRVEGTCLFESYRRLRNTLSEGENSSYNFRNAWQVARWMRVPDGYLQHRNRT